MKGEQTWTFLFKETLGSFANVCCRLQVITKKDAEGHRLEPFEEALVEVPEEFVGPVVDLLGSRKGQMVDLNTSDQGLTRVTYVIPTRSEP